MSNLTIMYSGGLDSFISWHYAISKGLKPQALFVDLGHPYAHKEWAAITTIDEKWRPKVDKLDLTQMFNLIKDKMTNQIIPSRNVLLATLGSMLNERVWVNALDGEQNGKERDKSEKFFEDTTALLSYINSFFQDSTIVESPFCKMSKAETITWALDYGIPKEVLFQTTTCYDAKESKCGKCLTCYKRFTAFLLNGIDEPGYTINPMESDYAKELEVEMPKAIENNDTSRFTQKRLNEFLKLKK